MKVYWRWALHFGSRELDLVHVTLEFYCTIQLRNE